MSTIDIRGQDALRNAVALVGHNARFDVSFLQSEYKRIGVEMPHYTTFDTIALAGGGTLSACCAEHGVKFDGRAHSALHDARATACLLQKFLLQNPDLLAKYKASESPTWPILQKSVGSLFPRESLKSATSVVPTYVQRLAERLSVGSANSSQPEGERDYRALLWRALEDGRVEEYEGNSLVEVATHWGLTFDRIKAIHLEYLSQLAKAAWADHHVSDAERQEIQLAARLLGFGRLSDDQLHKLLRSSENIVRTNATMTATEDWTGKSVCFTGECSCSVRGELITREMAEQLAGKGLRVMPSVTKSSTSWLWPIQALSRAKQIRDSTELGLCMSQSSGARWESQLTEGTSESAKNTSLGVQPLIFEKDNNQFSQDCV